MERNLKKARAPNLTDESIEKIVRVIGSWSGERLTWNLLIDAVSVSLKARYTRQALSKHTKIQIAYDTKNKALSARRPDSESTGNADLDKALRVIDELKLEVARLKVGERIFLEQFARWAHNATQAGIDYQILDRPIPPVDRNASLRASSQFKLKK